MTVESLETRAQRPQGFEGATLCEAFQATVARHPDAPALRSWDGAIALTWREYAERVARIAAGLRALGVAAGDTVALMLSNRPEFHVCDTAALHLGATPFSIYNTSAPEQITHLFANARNRVVICERQFLERVLTARAGTAVEQVICVDDPGGGAPAGGGALARDGTPAGEGAPAADGTLTLEQLEASAAEIDLEACWRAVAPEDVLTLIYTSGTTGPPKGAEITHASMLAMIRAWTSVMPATPADRLLSYLPAAHIVDRMTGHYLGMTHGVQLSCVADARRLPAALREVRPTLWIAVPRVWEKLQAALETAIAGEPDEQRRAVTQGAIALGERKIRAEQAALTGGGDGPDAQLLDEYARADELALGRLRAQLGLDHARFCCSGAAPASPRMLEFFGALGLEICEGWGMTELSGAGSANPPGAAKHGTVGPPLPGIEVCLAADGELLCRGATTMRGYRADRERTAEAIDRDGWLHTGDVAEIDAEGYVRIVDRKKELIINAAGKNMSPANIEAALKGASPLIGQCICVGDRRPYNVALIVLDPDAATAFAHRHGLEQTALAALAANDQLKAEVGAAVERANATLARIEQVKRSTILPCDWLPDGEELTPTMKLKRKSIAHKYAHEIERLYETQPAPATVATRADPSPRPVTLCEAFELTAAACADEVAIRTRGDAQTLTFSQWRRRSRDLAGGLHQLGLRRGDTLAIMLANRPEFHVVDVAALTLGATPFSVYPTFAPSQLEFVLTDAGARVAVVEGERLKGLLQVRDALPALEHVIVIDPPADASLREGLISLGHVEESGRTRECQDAVDAAAAQVTPDDVLTLIYTSGTTGPPKGVQVSHRNLLATLASIEQVVRPRRGSRVISWLPAAHIAERNAHHYVPIVYGLQITCCPDLRELPSYLTEVRPHRFFAAPRIWEKLKAGVEAKLAAGPPDQRERFERALAAATDKLRLQQRGQPVPESLAAEVAAADERVFSDLRATLGLDRLERVHVGAAPTPLQVLEFFHAIGVPVAELWGMSESCGAGCVNPPGSVKLGTVGPPAPGVELRLAEDGEVLLRTPSVMIGYRGSPERTAEAIDADGWLHTGDIGELDEDGYLRIVDRKKELIINAAGKNMSPANIEAQLKGSSPLIGQAVAIGDARPYNVALIVLDPDASHAWAAKHGLSDAGPAALCEREDLRAELARGVAQANSHLSRVEQIKRFAILPCDWLPGGEELTPTMKLKRKPIAAKYAEEIEALYRQ